MRKYIHRLEFETEGVSLAEVLSLRRREKDFFLRHDFSYVSRLNMEVDSLVSRLNVDAEANQNTLAI